MTTEEDEKKCPTGSRSTWFEEEEEEDDDDVVVDVGLGSRSIFDSTWCLVSSVRARSS